MNAPNSPSDSSNIPPPSIDLRERHTEDLRESEISDRAQFLLNLWLSQKTIDTIQKYKPTLRHKERIQDNIQALRLLGFSDPVKMIEKFSAILGYSVENIAPKIEGMRALGFSDPMKMIERNPVILGYSLEENIAPKIENIRALGFSDPVKMIEKYPAILGLNIEENIVPKIEGMRALGFSDPMKMIERHSTILGQSVENIASKIEGMQALGFSNPVKMIEKSPVILGLNIEKNITPKIEGMRALRFSDPVKMIEKSPVILGYSLEENIIPKMRLLDRMMPDATIWRDIIENMPSLLSYKYGKQWILLRWLYTLGMLNADIIPRFPRMNTYEIETFVLTIEELRSDTAFLSLPTHERARRLDSLYRSLKKHGNKASRREKILTLVSDTNKLVRQYVRVYPEKKAAA